MTAVTLSEHVENENHVEHEEPMGFAVGGCKYSDPEVAIEGFDDAIVTGPIFEKGGEHEHAAMPIDSPEIERFVEERRVAIVHPSGVTPPEGVVSVASAGAIESEHDYEAALAAYQEGSDRSEDPTETFVCAPGADIERHRGPTDGMVGFGDDISSLGIAAPVGTDAARDLDAQWATSRVDEDFGDGTMYERCISAWNDR